MKITINKKTWILSFVILFLPVALALELNLGVKYVGYADEIFSVLMTLYLLMLGINKQLERRDEIFLIILIVFTLIGLVSNFFSGLLKDLSLIALDAFWQWKVFVSFLGAKYLSRYDTRGRLLPTLSAFAKLLIVAAFVCGVLSFWVDLGMTKGYRYGIPSYSFIFGNEGRYGIIIAVALMIILMDDARKKNEMFYVVLAIVDMLLSTKGVVYIIIPIFLVLYLLFSVVAKRQKLNGPLIALVVIIAVFASGYQITEYLMDVEAPRSLLIQYGFITANTYFPLGSGFGTYGSEVAASHYSPLYVQYGWTDKWAMSKDNGFALNDNYLGTIVGETGYFGLLLFLIMVYMIFRQINTMKLRPVAKAMGLTLFVCMMVTFIATGIMKSSIGIMVFIVLGILVSESERREKLWNA